MEARGVTVRQLADLVGGTLLGNGELVIHAARSLDEAQAGDITFADSVRNADKMHRSAATAAVVPPSVPLNGKALIQVADPLAAFSAIFQHLHGRPTAPPSGIDARAAVHSTAKIGAEPSVHPFAVIGANSVVGDRCRIHAGVVIGRDCVLGDEVTLHPHVVLYDGTILGNRVILHAGVVLGADGFGYRLHGGRHVKVPQMGHVEVEADVEIGANSSVDRGTFEATRLGAGTKIDNLVQIAHNVQIGAHNLLVAQVGIGGSTTTGQYVVLAGQVGVADHVTIGDGAHVGAQSGITQDVPALARYLGTPPSPVTEQHRLRVTLTKLPSMHKAIRRILKHLGLPEHE